MNAKDETVQSAYLISTSEGYLDLLRLTLRNGARIGDKDSWNGTGLIRAAERGHHGVVGELLQAGIDRDHVNRIGYQAIHEAVWLGEDTDDYATTLRVLAAGGVQLNKASRDEGLTPLQMAQHRGYEGLEKVLTRMTTSQPPAIADSALLRAATRGDADGVAIALRAGADLEARDGRRRTALLLAAARDHVDAAKVLVALGADPDALDDRHDTPWLVTGVTGSVAMLETLLPANPDLSIENRFGGLSVIPASERGHVDYVRRVVSTDIDVNHVNRLGWTALLEAVLLGDGGPRPPGDRAHPPRRGSRPHHPRPGWGHCPGARPVEGVRRAREHPVGSVKIGASAATDVRSNLRPNACGACLPVNILTPNHFHDIWTIAPCPAANREMAVDLQRATRGDVQCQAPLPTTPGS